MPIVQEARPPYVVFETREVEDRQASIDKGHYVAKDVDYALICAQGSRDRTERIVAEWLEHIETESRNERFPHAWVKAYKEAYSAWKEGREIPENGTPIRTWPPLSPAQVRLLLDLRVRTVEDLAQLNDEGLSRLGMGARSLKQKAVDWLETSKDSGKLVEELNELRLRNKELEERDKKRDEEIAQIRADFAVMQEAMANGTLQPTPSPTAGANRKL